MKHFGDKRDWFFQKRFGLFLHWGIYAVGGLHEQELQRYQTPQADYDNYINQFTYDRFDANRWLDYAESAGMEYVTFTSKHHDGFCMWDTKTTDYQIMATPAKRDILRELAEACQRRKVPLMVYYSCVDWHHPAYPNLGRHHEIVTDASKHNQDEYLAYLREQIREICTNYGEIAGIWWDMNVPQWNVPDINDMIRTLQPGALINNRGFSDGDFSTPERDFNPFDAETREFPTPTEACDSIGINSWGFRKEEDYYIPDAMKRRMTRYLARGGNVLLNVGPQPDGEFPPEATYILDSIGRWYKAIKPALTAPPIDLGINKKDIYTTGSNKTAYVIINQLPESTSIDLRPFEKLPKRATLLNTGQDVTTTLEPIVYQRHLSPALRLRNLPLETALSEPLAIQLDFED